MTEDDTFRKLKQIPIREMRDLVTRSNIEDIGSALTNNGWNVIEYLVALEKFNRSILNN